MSNSIAPGSSANVNVRVTALTTNPNVPVTYKTIILKKNLVNGVNTLTQEMMSTTNTKYVIKYNYVLGEDINVPENCILEFDGGSISGAYVLNGINTLLSGNIKCFTPIAGTFANDYLNVTWFGAVGDDNTDNITVFNRILTICRITGKNMYIPEGVFALKNGNLRINANDISGTTIDPTDVNSYVDCHNMCICGEGKNSVIKCYYNGDVINVYGAKNLFIKDINVTGGIISKLAAGHGANLISIINIQNVHIKGCYLNNGYYEAKGSSGSFYLDGGKGITLHASINSNVTVTDCEIYNCAHGVDLLAQAPFNNRADSYVNISNVRITKCWKGVYLKTNINVNRQASYQEIDSALLHVDARTTNCFQAFDSSTLIGTDIRIQNVSDETVEQLMLNGNGDSWYDNISPSILTYEEKAAWAARIYGGKNNNITIQSYSKYLNYGFYLVGSLGIVDYQIDSENNVFNLKINDDVNIVPMSGSASITDESKLKIWNQSDQSYHFINSVFIINGCGSSVDIIRSFFNILTNLVLILDGIVYSSNIKTNKIEQWVGGTIWDDLTTAPRFIGDIPKDTNFNELTTRSGYYTYNRDAATGCTNVPTGLYYGILDVTVCPSGSASGGRPIVQKAFDSEGRMFIRTRWVTTWSNWKETTNIQ